jgi:multidrug resistance efflux pump
MGTKTARNSHEHKRFYLRHAVPVVVWLATVGCVVWLFYQRSARFEMVGIARGEVRQVAASSTGRIRALPVALFHPVTAGQTLAVVDTILDNEQTLEAEIQANLNTAAAEIEHLMAQLVTTRQAMEAQASNLEMTRAESYRRFCVDVEAAQLQVLDLKVEIAYDEGTLANLVTEVAAVAKLVDANAVASYELAKAVAQRDSLAGKIEENDRRLAQATADLGEATQRRDEFERQHVAEPSVDQALEVIRKKIRVQEESITGLLEQKKALASRRAVEIKSPIEGTVIPIPSRRNDALEQRAGEQVMRRIGEVVTAGDPILAVAQTEPTEIVAYVSEQQMGYVSENMDVELVKTRPPAQIAPSRVSSISPTIELMPQRLWRSPNIPQWGRPVLIAIPPGLSLVPGEVVGIRGL